MAGARDRRKAEREHERRVKKEAKLAKRREEREQQTQGDAPKGEGSASRQSRE
jgi:hypothetical protein